MATSKNIGAEWSVAYAVSIKRLDSQFMLCLLRLMSWPKLGHMHGDLVDDLRMICALLTKRPMVGFLIARRLKLPVDKTFALLSVLESKGHIHTVGANSMAANLKVMESVDTLTIKPVLKAQVSPKTKVGSSKAKIEIENSGDVLSQLWRVLNTDIVISKAARAKIDPQAPVGKEAGDVLSQLWHVLNTDIGTKSEAANKSIDKATALRRTDMTTSSNQVKTLKDVNGQDIKPEKSEEEVEEEVKDVMGQLWSVLNTDIAFKRQSDNDAIAQPSAAKTQEVAEVMSQLWRVLNTEIATKRQNTNQNGTDSLSDTTREANDKLSKLWRILDAEITIKKKPKIYVLKTSHDGVINKQEVDTTEEAVGRLSQFWNVLSSEITLAVPPERRQAVHKRR